MVSSINCEVRDFVSWDLEPRIKELNAPLEKD